jgi:hypothetical protein
MLLLRCQRNGQEPWKVGLEICTHTGTLDTENPRYKSECTCIDAAYDRPIVAVMYPICTSSNQPSHKILSKQLTPLLPMRV